MNDNSSSNIGCIAVLVVLVQIVFIGLKLLNVINWSWWYVLSPTLIYAGLWFITAIIIFRLSWRKERETENEYLEQLHNKCTNQNTSQPG